MRRRFLFSALWKSPASAKTAKLITAMLLLPTLAMAQTPNVDPSLKKEHKQTIGLSSGNGVGMESGVTLYMLVGPPQAEQFVVQESAVNGTFKHLTH
jgi:hypothetical protein